MVEPAGVQEDWSIETMPPEMPPAQAVPPEEIIRNLRQENDRLRRFREKTEIELEQVWLQRGELEIENGRLRRALEAAERVCREAREVAAYQSDRAAFAAKLARLKDAVIAWQAKEGK